MNNLLVIGNGFDLQCGLPSKFLDFYEFERATNKEFSNFYKGLRNIDLSHFRNWGGTPQKELVEKVGPLSRDLTLFDVLFILLEWRDRVSPNETRWCDIENVICESLLSEKADSMFSWKGVYNFLEQVNEHGKMVDSLIPGCGEDEWIVGYYLICCHIFDLAESENGFTRKFFYSFLFIQLRNFEKRFARYIRNIQANDSEYLPKAKCLLTKLVNDVSDIDTFNFTTLEVQGAVSYLHGRADSAAVIFGISNVGITNQFLYPFTKESRQCDLLSRKIFPSNGNKNYDKVTIYGHSLNPQDYNYFFMLFDRHFLYSPENCKTHFEFCYSIYDKKVYNNIEETHTDSVKKLLYEYSIYKKVPQLISKLIYAQKISFREV